MKDKRRAQETAKSLFLEGKLTAKEIASIVKVAERTISKWVTAGKWKEERAVRNVTPKEMENDVIEIINQLIMQRKSAVDASERMKIADELSKYNKLWENLKKDNKLALSAYITVLDELLSFQSTRHPDFTAKMVNLQREFIDHKASEYL